MQSIKKTQLEFIKYSTKQVKITLLFFIYFNY